MSNSPNSDHSYETCNNKQPYKCPVCNGTGLVSRPPDVAGDVESWYSSSTGPYECKVCEGKGILWN